MHQNVFATIEPAQWCKATEQDDEKSTIEDVGLRIRSARSSMEQRAEEIQKISARKDLQKKNIRVSQKISSASMTPSFHARLCEKRSDGIA